MAVYYGATSVTGKDRDIAGYPGNREMRERFEAGMGRTREVLVRARMGYCRMVEGELIRRHDLADGVLLNILGRKKK